MPVYKTIIILLHMETREEFGAKIGFEINTI